MASTSLVSDLRFQPGGWRDLATGLLGYLTFRVAGVLVVDGATLRTTIGGRLMVSWPERRTASGKRHPIVRPIDADVRREIERQVLDLMGDIVPAGAR